MRCGTAMSFVMSVSGDSRPRSATLSLPAGTLRASSRAITKVTLRWRSRISSGDRAESLRDRGAIVTVSEAPALPEEAGALEARLAEVRAAVAGAERAFKARYRFDPEQSIDPAELMEDLEAEIADVREYIGELEFELAQFVDMQQVKAWLDAMKQQMAAQRRREARR